jgi:hypothetical protein
MSMRTILIPAAALAGIALLAAPASAQPREERALRGAGEAVRQATPMVDRSVDSALELDVGPLLDALHPWSPRGRRMTLRELGRRDDPDFDRKVRSSIYRGGARAAATLDAMATAAPSIRRSMRELEAAIGTALVEARRPLPPEAWGPPPEAYDQAPPPPPPSDDEEDEGAPW